MVTHSNTLAWKIPWTQEPGRLQSMGSRRVRHDWATSLSLFTFLHWRRKWQLTLVFLPGESQGQGSLVGFHLWGRTESDTTEATQQQQQQSGNAESLDMCMSRFLRYVQTPHSKVRNNCCNNWHSRPQCVRVPVPPYSLHYSVLSLSLLELFTHQVAACLIIWVLLPLNYTLNSSKQTM